MRNEQFSIDNGRHAIVNGHKTPDDEYGAQPKGNRHVVHPRNSLILSVVESNDHGLAYLVGISIVPRNRNAVFVWRTLLNKMVDLKNITIAHQQVRNVAYSINH